MTQKTAQKFVSECGRATLIVDNDMALGVLHDFLMALKSDMVNRMVAAHQAHLKEIQDQAELPPHESELPAHESEEKVEKPEGE